MANQSTLGFLRAALASVVLLSVGCAGGTRPCSSSDNCSGDQVCQVGRCAEGEALPAQPVSRRLTIEPRTLAYFDDQTSGVPSELRFAASNAGETTLLIRFERAFKAKEIERAFLTLEPSPDALPSNSAVNVDIWRLADGAPLVRHQGEFPLVSGPADARALLNFAPPQTARIDVTDVVRSATKEGADNVGFILRSARGTGTGARYAVTSGHGPRLEVYVK